VQALRREELTLMKELVLCCVLLHVLFGFTN
jgi:hypothetical protein